MWEGRKKRKRKRKRKRRRERTEIEGDHRRLSWGSVSLRRQVPEQLRSSSMSPLFLFFFFFWQVILRVKELFRSISCSNVICNWFFFFFLDILKIYFKNYNLYYLGFFFFLFHKYKCWIFEFVFWGLGPVVYSVKKKWEIPRFELYYRFISTKIWNIMS